jgi:hypothetical protein
VAYPLSLTYTGAKPYQNVKEKRNMAEGGPEGELAPAVELGSA